MTNGRLDSALKWVQRTAAGGVSDGELLQRFVASGDEAAFELLVWRHQRLVFGVCRRVLQDLHDAEDAFQAVFLVLARKGRTIGRRESLAAWLYRVAYRCALTARAARARRARREFAISATSDLPGPEVTTPPAEQQELRTILDEELNRLPEPFRVPTVLCYLAGKTVDEAAEQLGCPRGTVASRLARARQRLRTRLARRGIVLPASAVALALGEAAASAAPDSLIGVTLTNIQLHAAGRFVSGAAAVVAHKVVRAMFLRKMLIGAMLLAVCAGMLFVSGNWALQALAQAAAQESAVGAPAQPAVPAPKAQPAPKAGADPAVQPAPALTVIEQSGLLEASQVIDIRSRATGTIDKVHIKEGATVKKGELLFDIDSQAARLDLEQARANLAAAGAQAKQAIATLERVRRLAGQNVVSREEVDERDANAAVATATLQATKAKVEQAQLRLDYTRIASPINGKISRLHVNAGQLITGNDATPVLATVMAVDPIALRFEMDERTFARYQQLKQAGKIQDIELRVRIAAADEKGYPHKATFQSFASTVDERKATIAVRGSLPNPQGQLLPGMYVIVHVTFVPAPAK
jgi:RND family efflux transporter MFP subunit